jgi:putative transposase
MLEVKKMTALGGSYKKGLNREILNTSPSAWISCLKHKAAEADTKWNEIPTRKVKPTSAMFRVWKDREKATQSAHARMFRLPTAVIAGSK